MFWKLVESLSGLAFKAVMAASYVATSAGDNLLTSRRFMGVWHPETYGIEVVLDIQHLLICSLFLKFKCLLNNYSMVFLTVFQMFSRNSI